MTKAIANVPQKKFSVVIQQEAIQNLISQTLGDDKRKRKFIASISSVVATNPGLQKCDPFTIINSALLGEALELAPSPQLGYFYMVPFDEKKWNPQTGKRELVRSVATFILGYKGYIQLAIRSGLYKDLDSYPIHEGEYLGRDKDTGKPLFQFNEQQADNEDKEVIGYIAYLELTSGFKKVIYWDKKKMMKHADKYSAAFKLADYQDFIDGKVQQKDMWKYSSYWYQDFDGMAKKTMLRQLISKWGIMSVELQQAYINDTSYQDENGTHYYDNESSNEEVVATVKQDIEEKTGSKEEPNAKDPGSQIKHDEETGEITEEKPKSKPSFA